MNKDLYVSTASTMARFDRRVEKNLVAVLSRVVPFGSVNAFCHRGKNLRGKCVAVPVGFFGKRGNMVVGDVGLFVVNRLDKAGHAIYESKRDLFKRVRKVVNGNRSIVRHGVSSCGGVTL